MKTAKQKTTQWHETILLLILLAEIAFFLSSARNFGNVDNLANIIRHSAEIGLLALAVMPVILAGGIDLSIGSILGLCAVLFGVFTHDWQMGLVASVALTLLAGAAAGACNAVFITVFRVPALIVTLGTFSLYRGLAEAITAGTKTYRMFPRELAMWGDGKISGVPVQGLIFGIVAAGIWFVVHRTVVGRSWRAIGFAPEGARFAGIPVQPRIAWTYVQAGTIAALAAILFVARLKQARADAGTGYELAAITAVVLGGTSIFGGVGTVAGTVIGIMAIAVLNNGIGRVPAVFREGIGGELASLLTGVLLIFALIIPAVTKALSKRRSSNQSTVSTSS